MKRYRLTLSSGRYLDFLSKEDLIKYLNENWKEEYFLTIRTIQGSGSCGFKVKGDLDLDLKKSKEVKTLR